MFTILHYCSHVCYSKIVIFFLIRILTRRLFFMLSFHSCSSTYYEQIGTAGLLEATSKAGCSHTNWTCWFYVSKEIRIKSVESFLFWCMRSGVQFLLGAVQRWDIDLASAVLNLNQQHLQVGFRVMFHPPLSAL